MGGRRGHEGNSRIEGGGRMGGVKGYGGSGGVWRHGGAQGMGWSPEIWGGKGGVRGSNGRVKGG